MPDYLLQLSTEEKLLISLCRLEFDSNQSSAIRDQMEAVTDWSRFAKLANEHGTIALCWNNIVETGNSEKIPTEYLNLLHKGYLASLARNTRIFELLKEVIQLAEEENIKVVLLKGLALERTVYGNKGLRQMNDLDILVRQNSAIHLRRKLLLNGFESIPFMSSIHEKIMPSYGKHLPEMYRNGLSVELHVKLFDQTGNSLTEKLFEESLLSASDSTDSGIYIPEPQLFFLYLVKHLDKHEKSGTSQLRLYTDLIVLLSAHYNLIIRENLLPLAETGGLQQALIEKLYVLKIIWGFTFPVWIEEQFEKADEVKIQERFLQFLSKPQHNVPEEEPDSLLKPLSDIPGFYNKFLFISGYLIPSLTFMKFRYRAKTKAVAFLYYPIRCVKLIKLLFSGKI